MKVRTDFVTNSSSSSFIIAKKYLDDDQIKAIREHYSLAKKMGLVDDRWDFPYEIKENEDFITGYVSMDNFAMDSFLEKIDVHRSYIVWGEYPFDLEKQSDLGKENKLNSDWRELLYEN